MINNKRTVEIARSYIGTPFHHQARKKGVGVDCVGLLICIARDLGYIDEKWDITGYSRNPDGVTLLENMHKGFIEISKEEMQPGDFVLVSFSNYPQHVGVIGDYVHGGLSIIHSSSRHGKVIETRLMFNSSMKFEGAFRYMEK